VSAPPLCLAFDVRDFSTGLRLGRGTEDTLQVLVPRRHTGLPPLVERSDSSVRLRELRNFFTTYRTLSGLVVVAGVEPLQSYEVRVSAPRYVPVETVVTTPALPPPATPPPPLPQPQPTQIVLHRDASFEFDEEETLFRGDVVDGSGAPTTGYDAKLADPEPGVAQTRVPINARGQFVIHAPDKKTNGAVDIQIFSAALLLKVVNIPVVLLHRTNTIPRTTVP